jgi:predicted dehydrogenase
VPIDVALLGCSHPHVADVLGVIASEPDLRLVAAWDEDRVPGPISHVSVSRAETAIARAHAVVICAPTDQRPALCAQAARAGRPLLVEKPLALTAAAARGVVREVERSRTPGLAALFLRELPALRRLRAILQERVLGRLASVSAAFAHAGATEGMFDGPQAWMRDPRRAGVGGFGDLALHLVDALAVLAPDEPPLVAATTLDGILGGAAVGRAAGVPLTLRAGWATKPGGLELSIAGSAGTAVLRDGVIELGDEAWVGPPPDAGEAVRAFAACLRARRFPPDGLERAARAQHVLESAIALR